MPTPIQITHETENNVLILIPERRLDGENTKAFFDHIKKLIQEGKREILLDLSKLDYMSSAGLRILSMLHAIMDTYKGSIAICSPTERIRELFDLIHLEQIINIYSNQKQAFDQFFHKSYTAPDEYTERTKILLNSNR